MLQLIYQIAGTSLLWLGAIILFLVAWMRVVGYLVNKYRDEEETFIVPISTRCNTCVNRDECSTELYVKNCNEYFNLKK